MKIPQISSKNCATIQNRQTPMNFTIFLHNLFLQFLKMLCLVGKRFLRMLIVILLHTTQAVCIVMYDNLMKTETQYYFQQCFFSSFRQNNWPDIRQNNWPDIRQNNWPDIQQNNWPDIRQNNWPDIRQNNWPDIRKNNWPDIRQKNWQIFGNPSLYLDQPDI